MDARLLFAFLVNQLAYCLNTEAHTILKDKYQLGFTHYLILAGIYEYQPCSQKQLAKYANITSAGVLHALRPLEDRGWISKEVAPHSQRSVIIRLKPKGMKEFQEMNRLLTARLHELLDLTAADLAAMNVTLKNQIAAVLAIREQE